MLLDIVHAHEGSGFATALAVFRDSLRAVLCKFVHGYVLRV